MAIFDLEDRPPVARKGFSDEDLKKRHTRALDGFKLSASYFERQRKREVEDLKFVDHDEQWDPTVKTQRAGNQSVNGLPPTPPRPAIVANQLLGPIQQLANTRRQARLSLEFAPKGGGANQETSEAFEDIVRALQAESRASIARNWAADRAEKAGMGWYRIDTEYCDLDGSGPEEAWNDQDIVWRRILNQASVYPDPHAQEPDFSDGRRLYVTEDLPLETYRDRYPETDLAGMDNSELAGIGDALPKWVFTAADGTDGEESQTIRIAECWEVREEADQQFGNRSIKKRVVYWSLMNAVEYLEEPREWNGAYIPIIPCVGEESNVDGERRWRGIVRPAKDSQISYNVTNSARMEAIALATKAPYIGYMETVEPFLEWWKQSAVRNYFILPIKAAYDKSGGLLPKPERNIQEPAIQAISMAAQSAREDIHTTTGVPPVALGQLDPHDRSGRAIAALQQQAELGSSGYLDNLTQITMAYEGKVVRDLIPRIFDRPGRLVGALGIDEKRRQIMLGLPFIEGPEGPVAIPGWQEGLPVPKEVPAPGQQPQPGQPPEMVPVIHIDLKQGRYSVAPVVGKSFATRREQAGDAIGKVMESLPPEANMVLAPAWIQTLDFPEAKQLAEILKNALPPQLRAVYQDENDKMPPQFKAQLQQLQQQNQQLTQALQGKQVEQQAKLQIAQMQEQGDDRRTAAEIQGGLQKVEIQAAASMANAQAKVDAENFRSYVDALETKIAHALDLHLERFTQALTHQHEAVQNEHTRQHEAAMSRLEQAHALQLAEQGRQTALEQQANAPAEGV